MLELAEEAFDEVALAIDAPIDGPVHKALAGRRYVGLCATRSDQFEERISVVTAVGDDVTTTQALEQVRRRFEVVSLARRKDEPHGQTVLIDERVDLGAQSATRAADGVIFAPFLPPAACWWARMIELSMKAIECGDLAAKVSKIRIQTPALAQRLKRL